MKMNINSFPYRLMIALNLMKRNLEMSASARSAQSKASSRSTRSTKSSKPKSMQELIQSQRKHQLNVEKDTISQITASTTSRDTDKSGVSQISINRNLANKLRSQISQGKKSGDINIEQISFGSNRKKK